MTHSLSDPAIGICYALLGPRTLLLGACTLCLCAAYSLAASPAPAKVVGPNACAECHKQEAEAWKGTHHFSTFREMPRKPAANEIARKMGIRRVKAESICLDCHFSTQIRNGTREPVAGVSCESCHGAGGDWIKVHSSFTGKSAKTESKEEAALRWSMAEQKGMIRPGSLYRLAKNCYSCHVVPQEELVNKGGHHAGSAFELFSWSQGEVRHSTWHTKGTTNRPATAERRRMLYLVGQGVELETAIRAVAKATARKPYAFEMAQRADRARRELALAAKAAPSIGELYKIVQAAHSAGLKLSNAEALEKAANTIAEQVESLSSKYDGSTLASIDALIPGADKLKGKAREPKTMN